MAATSTMTAPPRVSSRTLQVPGAHLYYEIRGAGPVLLLMPGGPADAETFRRIEAPLAAHYTVVTYDPRGLSRSTLDAPIDDARMVETFADDAARLLAACGAAGDRGEGDGRGANGDRKASVFASSGGAVIALELARRQPERLATVICHEPPCPDLLPHTARVRAEMEEICDLCARDGLGPAMQRFMQVARFEGGPPAESQVSPQGESGPEESPEAPPAANARLQQNLQFFFSRYIRNLARYVPDLAALKACSCRIVPAVGAESAGQLAHDGGPGLAKVLGVEAVVFPGGHGGFDDRPAAFAAQLLAVLRG
jgi:pimeloyl-ACP methyl ester carboxylesterase